MYKVCEKVALEGSIFSDGESMMTEVHNFEEAKTFLTKENAVEQVEERVRLWIKKLKDFIVESKQVKRENDYSGPQQELEYWKRRGAQFSQLVNRLQVFLRFFSNFVLSNRNRFIKKITESRGHHVTPVPASCTFKADQRLGRRGE